MCTSALAKATSCGTANCENQLNLLMQTMNPIPIRTISILSKSEQLQLRANRVCRLWQIAIASQGRELSPFLRLPLKLCKCRRYFSCNVIHTTTRRQQQITRAWRTTWRTATPLHDCRHRAAQPNTVTHSAVLAGPMLHQRFNFFDHCPSPRKNEPNTKITKPNTDPTQINSFKINIFISFELGVLGLLGL